MYEHYLKYNKLSRWNYLAPMYISQDYTCSMLYLARQNLMALGRSDFIVRTRLIYKTEKELAAGNNIEGEIRDHIFSRLNIVLVTLLGYLDNLPIPRIIT